MHDALEDPLLLPALKLFLYEERMASLDELLCAIRHQERDTMKEARLAGMIEAYETLLNRLTAFCEQQLKDASQ